MQKLLKGIHRFRDTRLGRYRELFERLSVEGQKPHTLFITCSDSRVLAELITNSKPGDLFVIKNVGNIVPSADHIAAGSTAAAIEYSVSMLGVSDIVVCGHSQCGAMQALLAPPANLPHMPHLATWLEMATGLKQTMEVHYTNSLSVNERIDTAAQENVLCALENLETYPCVQQRLADGTLRLHGWFFKIATADLFAYDHATRGFEPIAPEVRKRKQTLAVVGET